MSTVPVDFVNILRDFLRELVHAYPHLATEVSRWWKTDEHFSHMADDDARAAALLKAQQFSAAIVYKHCVVHVPPFFFDVLQQNEQVFATPGAACFLPNISFADLWVRSDTTPQTKVTIWRYLQVIMFVLMNHVDKEKFLSSNVPAWATRAGDAGESEVDDTALQQKVRDVMAMVRDAFTQNSCDPSSSSSASAPTNRDSTAAVEGTSSGSDDENDDEEVFGKMPSMNFLPQFFSMENMQVPEQIMSDMSRIINGSLGKIAHEITDEIFQEWCEERAAKEPDAPSSDGSGGAETASIDSTQDMMFQFIRDPSRFSSMMQKMQSKLAHKVNTDPSMSREKIMGEVSEMIQNLQNTPAMQDMVNQLGIADLLSTMETKMQDPSANPEEVMREVRQAMMTMMNGGKKVGKKSKYYKKKGHAMSAQVLAQMQKMMANGQMPPGAAIDACAVDANAK